MLIRRFVRAPFMMAVVAATLLPAAISTTVTAAADVSVVQQPSDNSTPGTTLVGRAVLPAATFADGPTSGQYIGDAGPFANKQPVQGFSAIHKLGDGTFWVMSDNGFGSITNSADYELRIYHIKPKFETNGADLPASLAKGDGSIDVLGHITLSDPDHVIDFAIVNHFTHDRVLTGADFDIESLQVAADGTMWLGDEFGPFLLHFDRDGRMLDAPIKLASSTTGELRAPQNPYNEEISTLRVMNAVRAQAQTNGNTKIPIISPWELMLDDGDDTTFVADRHNPTGNLASASSEIHNVDELHKAGYTVVPYTINTTERMKQLLTLGVDGIISDRPDLLRETIREHSPSLLTSDGRIDPQKFSAQGHRGGRDLRPENTLPAMEVALDNLMNTLETDTGISADGVPMLDHDPAIEASTCRKADGSDYTEGNEVLIKDHTAAEIQSTFICDKTFRGAQQVNDPALSPVAVAFAEYRGFIDPYVMPTVDDLFAFVDFYAEYYRTGAGQHDANAAIRAANAAEVRFNLEAKTNPRKQYAHRTRPVSDFVTALAGRIESAALSDRAVIQSFDWRTLLDVQQRYPSIQTGYLFGDFSYPQDDGTNLQDEFGANTPWLAGLHWPYRVTKQTHPFGPKTSGGFEGMAKSPDGKTLYPMLEKPLDGEDRRLRIFEFDTATGQYTGAFWYYPLEEKGQAIGDFIMIGYHHGLVIERDNSQGDPKGFKAIYKITLGDHGQPVAKEQVVDLMAIDNPAMIGGTGDPGDVSMGSSFGFPFITIEDVVILGDRELGIVNDNNYPFSVGRHGGSGQPDDNEFIVVQLEKSLTSGDSVPGQPNNPIFFDTWWQHFKRLFGELCAALSN